MNKAKHQSVIPGFSFLAAQDVEFVAPHSLSDCEKAARYLNNQRLSKHGGKLKVSLVPLGNMQRTKIHLQITTLTRFETELQAIMIPEGDKRTKIVGKSRITDTTMMFVVSYLVFLLAIPMFGLLGSGSGFMPIGFILFFQMLIMGVFGAENFLRALVARRYLSDYLLECLR